MQNKLQELTEKIYKEGVSKGNTEAEKIIGNAKSKSEKIIADAKKEAEKIIEDARKKSEEAKKNTESELKLASKQVVNALKQQMTDIINGKIVDVSVEKAFDDKEFIKKIIETTLKTGAAVNRVTLTLWSCYRRKTKKKLNSSFQSRQKTF